MALRATKGDEKRIASGTEPQLEGAVFQERSNHIAEIRNELPSRARQQADKDPILYGF